MVAVNGIEPDIDALKSVSNVGKFNLQAERNYQRNIAEPERRDILNSAQEAVKKKLGIKLIVGS